MHGRTIGASRKESIFDRPTPQLEHRVRLVDVITDDDAKFLPPEGVVRVIDAIRPKASILKRFSYGYTPEPSR